MGIKRGDLFAILFVLGVAVLLRYPRFPNEFAGDSLELHWYADALRQEGTAGWTMSPLSWFGLYPISYSEGVPIVAATLGEYAGISSGEALALSGVMTGLLGVLGFVMLAHRLGGSFIVGLVAGATLATSGFGVAQTIGGLSGRALLQAFFPFAVWAMIPVASPGGTPPASHRLSRGAIFLTANFAMAASHRLFLLVILTEIVLLVGLRAIRWISTRWPMENRGPLALRLPTLVLAGGILLYGAYVLEPARRAGPGFLSAFLLTPEKNLFLAGYLLEFAWNVGPLIALIPFGIWATVRGDSMWSAALGGLLVSFAIETFLVVPSFSIVTLALPAAILVGMGGRAVVRLSRSSRLPWRIAAQGVIVATLLGALLVQAFFVSETQEAHRNPDQTSFFVDQESVESGVYIRWDTSNTTFITPDLTDARRVASAGHVATVSSETMLFGADPTLRDKVTIVYSLQGRDNPLDPVFYLEASQSLIESKTLFQANDWIIPDGGYGQGNHWGQAVTLQTSTDKILDAYRVDHVVLNNYPSTSPMARVTRSTYYVEYGNWLESVYTIQHDADCMHGQPGCP